MSTSTPAPGASRRPLLIAALAVTSVVMIGAVAVLLTLLLGPGRSVVVAAPFAMASGSSSTSTSIPTPSPDPTVTVTVPASGGTSSTLAITSFTISPSPADCGDPVNVASVPLHVHWTSTGATKAMLSINGGALPITLPASGSDADIRQHYPSFAYDCSQRFTMFTLTVVNGVNSVRQLAFVATEFAGLH
jgi:hypothetical protein